MLSVAGGTGKLSSHTYAFYMLSLCIYKSLSSLNRADICSLQDWVRSDGDSEFVSMGRKKKDLIVVDSGPLKHKDRGQKEHSWRGE